MPAIRRQPEARSIPGAEAEARLRRVLLHERGLDYNDRAVIGGLDGLLSSFSAQIKWLNNMPPRKERRYSSLGPGERQMWVESVLQRLGSSTRPDSPGPVPVGPNVTSIDSDGPATARSQPKPSARKPRTARPGKPADPSPVKPALTTPLGDLEFITRATATRLAKTELATLKDLLWHFPRRHIDYSKPTQIGLLELGQETTVIGHVVRAESLAIGRSGAARVLVSDGTGLLSVTFFGQPYLASQLKPGTDIALSGKVGEYRGQAQLESPEYEVFDRRTGTLTHAGNLLPVYPTTEGLPQRTIRNATRAALDIALPLLKDMLPADMVDRHAMPGLKKAISDMHFPAAAADAEAARRRLAFDELLLNQLLVLRNRQDWQSRTGSPRIANGAEAVAEFLAGLDFDLTGDQRATLSSLLEDMATGVPMARLLQGEVGSGKTIVALAAILACVANGYRGAFLAPTEVLAEQHFLSTTRQLGAESTPLLPATVRQAAAPAIRDRPITIGLLTGSQTPVQKSKMHELIAAGQIDIVIGTHALLQESVDIPDLALAVVDEQHRFGVEQRAALGQREPRPHMLAMSATPIPRTLALTVYGDLDVSVLKQMPSGRAPLKTVWARDQHGRHEAYDLVRSQVAEGRQAFIVCPLIEDSEAVAARAAVPEFARLTSGPLSDLRLGLLHGRMPIAEKQLAMERFRSGETQVLVATPVIEVGVDVPNATVMLIESADRFGLSQLHQLRGRVGRGGHAGSCYLLSDSPSEDGITRLRTVEETSDGFELADKDLEMRGPGEYTGTRQSGWAQMKIATPADLDLIETCREEAGRLLAADPQLAAPELSLLAAELALFAVGRPGELS
ncbi:MAG: ATP-dependent DNA helicase RecG [Chloroflexi bacterium]|nr:ATP-dependent DNA helicase RecG [Chloroflexota bacterium]